MWFDGAFLVCFSRGVLQSLVEKHFPAPDRQKLFSLLGIDLSAKKTPSPIETTAVQKGKKRKGRQSMWISPCRVRSFTRIPHMFSSIESALYLNAHQ